MKINKFWITIMALSLTLSSCGGSDDDPIKEPLPPEAPETPEKPDKPDVDVNNEWYKRADLSTESLIEHYWNGDGYFNYECDKKDGGGYSHSYWPQAHAMDVMIDAYIRTGSSKYRSYFSKWYTGVLKKNGNSTSYKNAYFDDMEWIALTMIRLYEVTGEQKYMTTAQQLWGWIKEGWNEQGGGGVAWVSDKLWSKNACSNGPAGLVATRLYQINKNEDDKKWAIKIYDWMREKLYDASKGKIYDNLDARTDKLATFSLSYNQGTFMGMCHDLYKITGEKGYMNDARKAANFCITDGSMLDVNNNVLRDEGETDGGLFKGIFIRYFVPLILDENLEANYRNKFLGFFTHNAEVLWDKGTDKSKILFGPNWAKQPSGTIYLSGHTSGCTMFEARAYYEIHK